MSSNSLKNEAASQKFIDQQDNQFGPQRPYYLDGVMLDSNDLVTEQEYHRGRLARSLRYLHGVGTAAGLVVEINDNGAENSGEEVTVSPGIAVDRRGRLIEVRVPQCIRINKWLQEQLTDSFIETQIEEAYRIGTNGQPDHIAVDVFISFAEKQKGHQFIPAPMGVDSVNASVPSRIIDRFSLVLTIRHKDDDALPTLVYSTLAGNTAEEKLTSLKAFKLKELWQETSEHRDENNKLELETWHVPGVHNGDEVFLCRLNIPMTQMPLERNEADSIRVDNESREWLLTNNEVAWLAGLL